VNALVEAALELRSRVIAADPVRQRVRLGSRASLSLVLALAVMSAVTHVAGQPFSVAMLGAVVGMVTSNSVKDETHRSQVLTIALAPLASAAAVTVAATLSKHQVLADIAFVVVMVTAVWARRFGPSTTAALRVRRLGLCSGSVGLGLGGVVSSGTSPGRPGPRVGGAR